MNGKEKVEKLKCISEDCGHEPEPGYTECRGCEARRRGVALCVVAQERRQETSTPIPYLKRGW